MSINVPLLRKVLEHVTEHPEEWNQGVWAKRKSCGTAYCVAGHVAVMTGHKLQWDDDRAYTTDDGRPIMTVAAKELGISNVQAAALFEGSNRLSDLWGLASYYTNGEIEVPESVKAYPGWDD